MQNAVMQKVNPDDGRLGGIQFGYHPLRVGIHESLLINVAHSLDCAHIKSVLGYRDRQDDGSLSRRMLIILLFTFQSLNLCFGQHLSLFSGHFFQNGQPLFHGGKVMALPDGAHSRRRNEDAAFA